MASANSVVIVGHLLNDPSIEGSIARCAVSTHETDLEGKVYFTQNFIKAIDKKNVEIMKNMKKGMPIALTGRLETNNKITSVIIKTIEGIK